MICVLKGTVDTQMYDRITWCLKIVFHSSHCETWRDWLFTGAASFLRINT